MEQTHIKMELIIPVLYAIEELSMIEHVTLSEISLDILKDLMVEFEDMVEEECEKFSDMCYVVEFWQHFPEYDSAESLIAIIDMQGSRGSIEEKVQMFLDGYNLVKPADMRHHYVIDKDFLTDFKSLILRLPSEFLKQRLNCQKAKDQLSIMGVILQMCENRNCSREIFIKEVRSVGLKLPLIE